MSLHEKNQETVQSLITSISQLDSLDLTPNLSNSDVNRFLANFKESSDIESLLQSLSRYSLDINTVIHTIQNYCSESIRNQSYMLARILDIPPYIDTEIDDFY